MSTEPRPAAKLALYEAFAEVGKALASPLRLLLLDLLAQAERSVDELAAEVGAPRANTSAQLQVLHGAALVSSRKEGTRVYYRLASDDVARLVTERADGRPRPARRGRASRPGLPGRPHRPGAGEPGGTDPRPGHGQAAAARREAGGRAPRRSHPRGPLHAPGRARAPHRRVCPATWRSSPTAAAASASTPPRRCGCCATAASPPTAWRTASTNGAAPAAGWRW